MDLRLNWVLILMSPLLRASRRRSALRLWSHPSRRRLCRLLRMRERA